jgi:hypothetical protein
MLKKYYSWVPAYFTVNYETYANQVCWVSNTYYTNQTQNLPKSEEVRKQSEIKYYQWIPVIRLFFAFKIVLLFVFFLVYFINPSSFIVYSKNILVIIKLKVFINRSILLIKEQLSLMASLQSNKNLLRTSLAILNV